MVIQVGLFWSLDEYGQESTWTDYDSHESQEYFVCMLVYLNMHDASLNCKATCSLFQNISYICTTVYKYTFAHTITGLYKQNHVFAWVDINVSSSVDPVILHQVVLHPPFQTVSKKIQFSIPLGQKSLSVYAPSIIIHNPTTRSTTKTSNKTHKTLSFYTNP